MPATHTSASNTNGSPFAGLTTSPPFYNPTLASAVAVSRFVVIIPVLSLTGSLARGRRIAVSIGTRPTTGGLWVGLLLGVIVIVAGLTCFPALALGSIADRPAMSPGTVVEFTSGAEIAPVRRSLCKLNTCAGATLSILHFVRGI